MPVVKLMAALGVLTSARRSQPFVEGSKVKYERNDRKLLVMIVVCKTTATLDFKCITPELS